jgi:hypothetical protein
MSPVAFQASTFRTLPQSTVTAGVAALPIIAAQSELARYFEQIRRFPLLKSQGEFMLAKRLRERGDRVSVSALRARPEAAEDIWIDDIPSRIRFGCFGHRSSMRDYQWTRT